MCPCVRWFAMFGALSAAGWGGYLLGARKDAREQMMEADRAFDKATAERGVEGWVSYFAEDGRMIRSDGQVVQGHKAIGELMGPMFADKSTSLRWAPDFAEASKSGDLGYTSGTSKLWTKDAQGREVERDGRYVTIWRRVAGGQWKAVLDIGSGGPLRPVKR